MQIAFSKEILAAVQKAGVKSPALMEEKPWRDVQIESRLILPDDYDVIKKVVQKEEHWTFIKNRRIFRKIQNLEKIRAKGSKKIKITNLELLCEALRDVISKSSRKWIFMTERGYEASMPYFVSSVHFVRPEVRIREEAHTRINLHALARGKKEDDSVSFYRKDLGGTVEEILERSGIFLESEDLLKDYEEESARYAKVTPQTGEQFNGTGKARKFGDGRWHRDEVILEREGEPAKLVIDDEIGFGEETAHYSTAFWVKAGLDEEDEENAKDYAIPVHPIVRAFDLWRQEFFTVHVSNLTEYVYDEKIGSKIILPETHKRLVEALTTGAVRRMDDIVRGKARGIILLCTGKPGTGKTLTAEVYSEVAKRPLYTVQCSQLGTDSDALEKNLSEVLERSARWRAILLIDEADVYIHERGIDVEQNAIVGVFLRLLEYYNGILFMNTNREEVIDDAILSRATAHVKYAVPDAASAGKIWKLLAEQYGIKLSGDMLLECMKEWKGVSGRLIRQILRLAKMMADQDVKPVSMDHLRFAASFQQPE